MLNHTMEAFRRWRTRERARRELDALNDLQLADIGITRSDIEAAVRGELRRPAA
ncbi:MAG: DUF1127 domain-containing protein [Alphaproteobacteria bacterium]